MFSCPCAFALIIVDGSRSLDVSERARVAFTSLHAVMPPSATSSWEVLRPKGLLRSMMLLMALRCHYSAASYDEMAAMWPKLFGTFAVDLKITQHDAWRSTITHRRVQKPLLAILKTMKINAESYDACTRLQNSILALVSEASPFQIQKIVAAMCFFASRQRRT